MLTTSSASLFLVEGIALAGHWDNLWNKTKSAGNTLKIRQHLWTENRICLLSIHQNETPYPITTRREDFLPMGTRLAPCQAVHLSLFIFLEPLPPKFILLSKFPSTPIWFFLPLTATNYTKLRCDVGGDYSTLEENMVMVEWMCKVHICNTSNSIVVRQQHWCSTAWHPLCFLFTTIIKRREGGEK